MFAVLIDIAKKKCFNKGEFVMLPLHACSMGFMTEIK